MLKQVQAIKKISGFSLVLAALFCVLSCTRGSIDPFDLTSGLHREEVENIMMHNPKEEKLKKLEKSQNETPIPNISKLIVSPPPPSIGGDKIISFSVTDQVPLKDVLIELGRVAKIDIDLDPSISGGIILNATNRPLKEIIDRIATLGQLRYSYKNGVLYFERDTPYMKNYFVDYINGGSVWTDVEANISAVLSGAADSESSSDASSEGASSSSSASAASFTSNKSAGIISVFATKKQHAAITNYLADVEKYASTQVLIEAKVVEVSLNREFQAGINWTKVKGVNTIVATNGYTAAQPLSFVTTELFGSDLNLSISALETFGLTKTISSPRIHAMNNQKASLNFADKLIYFKVEQAQSTSSNGATNSVVATTITSTKQEENVGVEIALTPSINLKTGEITMSIQPKLSVKSGEVTDPASPRDSSGAVIAALVNRVPIIQTRQLDTIAKIQNGNILVIGGLMKEDATNTDEGIPFLNRIPIFSWFFKSIDKSTTLVETVIFIKATIVNSGTPVKKTDRNLQEKFDPIKLRYFD